MSEPKTDEALARHGLTKGFSDQHQKRLAEGVQPFEVEVGEHLFREGEAANAFYLLQSGHVEIGTHLDERGSAAIQRVGAGDAVGWSWSLPPYRWEFDARAVDAVTGMAFDAAWLREQCERDHELGYHLLRQLLAVVSRRLAALRLQRMDIIR